MRDVLCDLVDHTAGLFEVIRVAGTEEATRIQGVSKDKHLFMEARLAQPEPELAGDYALNHLNFLSGLLDHSTYAAPEARVFMRRDPARPYPTAIEFQDGQGGGGASSFKTAMPAIAGKSFVFHQMAWDVSVEPTAAKITEFSRLASLFARMAQTFRAQHTSTGELVFALGADSEATHQGRMVFAADLRHGNDDRATFDLPPFLTLLKMGGAAPPTVRLSHKDAVLQVSVASAHAHYDFYLRARDDA